MVFQITQLGKDTSIIPYVLPVPIKAHRLMAKMGTCDNPFLFWTPGLSPQTILKHYSSNTVVHSGAILARTGLGTFLLRRGP